MTARVAVAKTYKLYLGGAFVRSESGRSDPATDHAGAHEGAADEQLVGLPDREAFAHDVTRRYGRSPAIPPSRPKPLSLYPPNAADGSKWL